MQPFGHNRCGPKIGWELCPFRGGGAGSSSNTMWPGLRPSCMPSFILIRPTVWPQCTNVTDRQDRTERSDSIGRNRFTNGRPKTESSYKNAGDGSKYSDMCHNVKKLVCVENLHLRRGGSTAILVHGQVTIIFVVSVGLSVCLFVCLCRVFLIRL